MYKINFSKEVFESPEGFGDILLLCFGFQNFSQYW